MLIVIYQLNVSLLLITYISPSKALFTKVKSIIESLESRGLIIKISDHADKRRKFLDVTNKGNKYICELIQNVDLLSK